ncbi:hypothetical protein [Streptomyces capillispiralis]|uniref:Secreted protein n=1 Tax=Streptomyces capillispiralis TaxID=68182 RepID=A0A561TS17_9ACTN|nr:hypothetical protein [Streptomyces capillispiralis]TWF89896.1 hypothetical protein FHX78_116944 [Streptomyces capillispiralis]GHH95722.1 hypothetical protein GCM10017779_61790 [Streptomyces capillispiralis]
MRSIRRIFSVGAAALMLGAGLVAGSSGAAQAAASDCTGGRNGFTDIPDSLSGRGVAGAGALVVEFPVNVPYAVVSYAMQTGTVGGRQMGWGVLSSGSIWGPGATGQVWMDVTNDNKQSWIQCGPFYLSSANGRITTPAYPTSSSTSRAFRVCAMAAIPVRDTGITCTPWW